MPSSTGVETIWSDLAGGDAPDAGWSFSGGTWAGGNPFESPPAGPDAGYDGDPVIAQNLAGNYNSGENSYAQSPVIDCSSHSNVTLSFRGWKGAGKSDQLYVDAWDGETWRRVYSYSGPNGGANDSAWTGYASIACRIRGWESRFQAALGTGGRHAGQQRPCKPAGRSIPSSCKALADPCRHPRRAWCVTVRRVWCKPVMARCRLEFSQPMDTRQFHTGRHRVLQRPGRWHHVPRVSLGFTIRCCALISPRGPRSGPTHWCSGRSARHLRPGDGRGLRQRAGRSRAMTVTRASIHHRLIARRRQRTCPPPWFPARGSICTWQDNSSNETGFKLQRGDGRRPVGGCRARARGCHRTCR